VGENFTQDGVAGGRKLVLRSMIRRRSSRERISRIMIRKG
jgi:hypothetical protein